MEHVGVDDVDILAVRAQLTKRKSIVVCVLYFDVAYRTRNKRIMSNLSKMIGSISEEEGLVIMGDFNGHVGFLGPQRQNWNGKMMLDLIDRQGLILLNADVKCKGEITRRHRNEVSTIDYVLMNRKLYEMYVGMTIDEEKHEFDLSDHCLMVVQLEILDGNRGTVDRRASSMSTYFMVDDNLLKEIFLGDLEKELEDCGDCVNMKILEELMRGQANRHLKRTFKIRKNANKPRNAEPVWMNGHIKKEIALRKTYNRRHINAENACDEEKYWKLYISQKQRVKILVKKEVNIYEKRLTREIKESKDSGKKMWQLIAKMRGDKESDTELRVYDGQGIEVLQGNFGEMIFDFWKKIYQLRENRMMETWNRLRDNRCRVAEDDRSFRVDFLDCGGRMNIPGSLMQQCGDVGGEVEGSGGDFINKSVIGEFVMVDEVLLEHMDMAGVIRREGARMRKHMDPVGWSKNEVKAVLSKIRKGKMAGPDGLRGEIFKWMLKSDRCVEVLTKCLNGIDKDDGVPDSWKQSRTVLIKKKRKPEVKDFRPIALTNVGYKIYMSLVKGSLVKQMMENGDISVYQSGFTAGRRAEDNRFMLDHCIRGSFNMREMLVLISVDFSKAFDSVDRGFLIEVLVEYGCYADLVDIVARLYTGDTTEVFCAGEKIGASEVMTGIRQGCTGSPLLFLMVINIVIREMCATGMGNRDEYFYVPTIFYADDGLILSRSRGEGIQMMGKLREAAARCGLEINNGKSQCMVYCGRRNWVRFGEVDGIKVTGSMKYLGAVVNDGRQCFREHKRSKLLLAEKMTNVAYSVVARACNRLLLGKTYWKCVVLPSVLHGSAMVTWMGSEMDELQRVDNKIWRVIFRAPIFTPVRALQGEVGAFSAKSRDMKIKLRFAKHLLESNNCLLREMMRRRVEGVGKDDWMQVVRRMTRDLDITSVLQLQKLDAGELKSKIDEFEERSWRTEIEKKSTLVHYRSKMNIRDEGIYGNDEASIVMFRARTKTLALGWRKRFVNEGTECLLCNQGMEEDLKHFVLECDYLRDVRENFGVDGEITVEEVLMLERFDADKVDKHREYLLEIWRARTRKLKEIEC